MIIIIVIVYVDLVLYGSTPSWSGVFLAIPIPSLAAQPSESSSDNSTVVYKIAILLGSAKFQAMTSGVSALINTPGSQTIQILRRNPTRTIVCLVPAVGHSRDHA